MTVKKITPVRVNPVLVHLEEKRFNLNGQWNFRLDPDDRGVEERWFDDTGILVDRISVPGCWQGQGFGSDDRDVVWDFKLEARTFRATCKDPAGEMEVIIPSLSTPVAAILRVTLREENRSFTNRWNVWLFPTDVTLPSSVGLYGVAEHTWLKDLHGIQTVSLDELTIGNVRAVLAERFDRLLVEFTRTGGHVILAASEGLVRPFMPKFGFTLGHYFFTPPANYPPYEDGHDGTIISDHPMLGDMPQEGFADLQFFRMITSSPPLDLELLGLGSIEPVIRVMHSYPVCRPLAYLLECSLGKGRLILCALNLDQSLPEARHLLARICAYAVGDGLRPAVELSDAAVERIVAGTSLP